MVSKMSFFPPTARPKPWATHCSLPSAAARRAATRAGLASRGQMEGVSIGINARRGLNNVGDVSTSATLPF